MGRDKVGRPGETYFRRGRRHRPAVTVRVTHSSPQALSLGEDLITCMSGTCMSAWGVSAMCRSDLAGARVLTHVWNCTNVCMVHVCICASGPGVCMFVCTCIWLCLCLCLWCLHMHMHAYFWGPAKLQSLPKSQSGPDAMEVLWGS